MAKTATVIALNTNLVGRFVRFPEKHRIREDLPKENERCEIVATYVDPGDRHDSSTLILVIALPSGRIEELPVSAAGSLFYLAN